MENKEEVFSVVIFSNTVTPYCVHVEKVIKLLDKEASNTGLILQLHKFPNFLDSEMLRRFTEYARAADLILLTPINYDHENFHVHRKERITKEEAITMMQAIVSSIEKGIVIEVANHLENYSPTPGKKILTAENWDDEVIIKTIKKIIKK